MHSQFACYPLIVRQTFTTAQAPGVAPVDILGNLVERRTMSSLAMILGSDMSQFYSADSFNH